MIQDIEHLNIISQPFVFIFWKLYLIPSSKLVCLYCLFFVFWLFLF